MQENNNVASKTDTPFYLVHFIVMLLHCEKAINLVNEGIGQDFKDKKMLSNTENLTWLNPPSTCM